MSDDQENDEPVLLAADNFTPPSRTPWGGQRIRALKRRWVGDGAPVGEAWELSVEPSFPSRCDPGGEPLAARIRRAPEAWLGEERGGTALLVKLLDAAEPLSVQIHPRDGAPGLQADESGKPECWYVVRREERAGIYLGLNEGVDAAAMAEAIDRGGDASALLPFVPVEPGDFFVIEAGTPHCIGGGVTLVEPQRVAPRRRGVTYRYWDWGRRYAADGALDPGGQPRALHRDEALASTDWSLPRGDALLARVRLRAGPADRASTARVEHFCAPSGAPLVSSALRVARLAGSGEVTLPAWPVLRAITVLEGEVELEGLVIEAGRTAALPAAFTRPARLRGAHAIVAAVS